MGKFKTGDIIKGRCNKYARTNENMTKGKVLSTSGDEMRLKILEHKNKDVIGMEYDVDNTTEKFEIISFKKPTKQELFDMPVGTKIITNAEDKEYKEWIKTLDEEFTNESNESICECDIKADLSLDTNKDYGTKIIKIEKPTYETVYDYSTEVQEMTVAEIEKVLGHAVKIVKEREED